MAASPAKSPRLPSPPPIAEDQLGPNSPLSQTFEDATRVAYGPKSISYAAARRIRPGVRSEDMPEGPPLIDLQSLTEHLKAMHAAHITPDGQPDTIQPVDKATATQLAQPPPGIDRGIWLYELCRFLTQKANAMAVGLFATEPPCSAQTCHEMRASEWQYLCAAHDPPKSCCAIDYCCHTLDWAATQLTSSTLFPSRLALGTEGATSTQQLRKMTEIFRRVYRIFAHAWFQHQDVFWQIENKTGLYVFFKTVCDEYKLIPEDNYTIPPEAEGRVETTTSRRTDGTEERGHPVAGNVILARGNTTKRHRGTRMEQPNSISTIIHEETEDEASKVIEPTGTVKMASEPFQQDQGQNEDDDTRHDPTSERADNTSLPIRLKASEADEEEEILTAIDLSAHTALSEQPDDPGRLSSGAVQTDQSGETDASDDHGRHDDGDDAAKSTNEPRKE